MRRVIVVLALLAAGWMIPRPAAAQANVATFIQTVQGLSMSAGTGAGLLAAIQADAQVSGIVPQIAQSVVAGTIAADDLQALQQLGLVEPLTALAGAGAAPAASAIPAQDLAPGTQLPGDPPTFVGTVALDGNRLVLRGPSGTQYRLVDGLTGWTAILDQMQPSMVGVQASVRGWPATQDANTLMVTEFLPNAQTADFAVGRIELENDQILLRVGDKRVYVEDPAMLERLRDHAPLPSTPEGAQFNTGTGFIIQGNITQENGRNVLRNARPEVWVLTAPNSYGLNQAVDVDGVTVVSGDVPNGAPNQMLTYGSATTPADINSHSGNGTQVRNTLRALVYGRLRSADEVPENVRAAFPQTVRYFEALDYRWSQPADLAASGFTANTSFGALIPLGLIGYGAVASQDDDCKAPPDAAARLLGIPHLGAYGRQPESIADHQPTD